ncbi:MAG: TonB-dependent receptor [Bacteroidetes bacterium]|nr:TonB-dependent receptor [Bacteroidota bacterium]
MIKKLFFVSLLINVLPVISQTEKSKEPLQVVKPSDTNSPLVPPDSTVAVDNQADTTSAAKFNLPIFSTSGADADADMDNQDVSGLLQSSRDVFTQFASFQFGVARYRMRGYASENQQVLINGVNVNNLENGTSTWSSWGGLNDVTRFVESRFGNGPNRLAFSGAGGYTNIDSKASSFRKGTRVSYANANRIFRHRTMITHSTGMMQNGWAITLSASNRVGDQVYLPGTYINANSFYASIDKRWSDRHTTSLVAFNAPTEQGRTTAEQLEAFEITGSNYYNSLWGYQNGKVRNSSIARTNRPMMILSHIWNMKDGAKLTASASYNWGEYSISGLNWNNSPNPRPDYYRYLPSYYYRQGETAKGDAQTQLWNNDVNTRQINWDRLIAMNQANLYTVPVQSGGVNTTETRSRYILENRVENLKNAGLTLIYNKRIEKLFISGGLNANMYKNNRYKTIEDLLGGSFWLDYDQFAQNLGVDATYQQNNITTPDRKVKQGEKFGFDYTTNVNHGELWGQGEYSFTNLDVYAGVSLASSQIYRTGNIANGKFPTTSKGDSKKLNYLNYGVKGGATYKIDGRNFITANGSYLTRPPEVNNIFVSPRTRNDIVNNGVSAENIASMDISYLAKYPGFKVRLTYYNTAIKNQVYYRVFWSDEYNNNVNYLMTGVNQQHQGVELGLEKTLFTAHVIQGVFGYGNYYYTNRPTAQAWQDNNNTQLFSDRTVYLKNYRIGGTPQTVAGLGYRYNGIKRWYAGITYNYFAQNFLEPNPDRRTAEAVQKYTSTDPMYKQIVEQEQLPDYFLVNANAGKSFRIASKYILNVSLTVNNLLNNKNIRNWGYEQMRWDYSDVTKFGEKYQYMPGATYMAMINFTF